MSAKELLTRKVGPLPVYGWVLGVGGGLLVAAWIRRAYSGASADLDAATAMDGDAGYLSPTDGTGGAAYSDPNNFPDAPAGGPKTPAPPRNNNEWRKDAIRAGIAFGWGAIAVQGTVDRYLTGGRLSTKQRDRMNRIIQQVGPPPKATKTPTVVDNSKSKHGGRPRTNREWKERGVARMRKAGYNGPNVDEALTRYLHGRNLTGRQRALVLTVIGMIGAAPHPPRRAAHHGRTERDAATPTTRRDTGANL